MSIIFPSNRYPEFRKDPVIEVGTQVYMASENQERLITHGSLKVVSICSYPDRKPSEKSMGYFFPYWDSVFDIIARY